MEKERHNKKYKRNCFEPHGNFYIIVFVVSQFFTFEQLDDIPLRLILNPLQFPL